MTRVHFAIQSNGRSKRHKPGGIFRNFIVTCEVLIRSLTETRRLSEFTMIEEPLSVRDLQELVGLASDKKASPIEMLDKLREATSRLAVAEVTLTSGVWPFRKSSRVRVIRPSGERYWAFENGDYTPGMQCEELERRWSLQYDFQRQFLLKRNLDTATSSTPNT